MMVTTIASLTFFTQQVVQKKEHNAQKIEHNVIPPMRTPANKQTNMCSAAVWRLAFGGLSVMQANLVLG